MADVHVFHIFQIFHGAAGVVGDVVDRPDGVVVSEGVVAAVLAEVHPPDHLGAVPEVLPNLGEDFIIQLAVVQHEAAAIVHHRQRPPQFRLAFVADGLILVNHFLVGGGEGLAEEGEGVLEGDVGCGILQRCHILQGKAAAQFHGLQIRQHSQLFAGLTDLGGGHAAQVQLGGVQGNILGEQGDGVIQLHIRIGFQQRVDLLRGQVHGGQGNGGKLGKILQILQQQFVSKAARLQHYRGSLVADLRAAQGDGVGHVHLGMLLHIFQNGGVAGAAAEIYGLQVGVVVQCVNFSCGQHHRQGFHFFFRVRGGGSLLRNGRGGQGDDLGHVGHSRLTLAAAQQAKAHGAGAQQAGNGTKTHEKKSLQSNFRKQKG